MSAVTVSSLLVDLAAEHDALDAVVAGLDDGQWATPTASPGWSVADQIAHLGFFDERAAAAIVDPDGFTADRQQFHRAVAADAAEAEAGTLERARSGDYAALLIWWRTARHRLIDVAGDLADDARIPWYGPDMGAKSFLTARLMETWAHGQDVVDAVGATRPVTDRLAHIAQLGFITRGWSYRNRGLEPPAVEVRVVLTAPGGGEWHYGPPAAQQSVSGPAEDFCLVVTQRRRLADTTLVVQGDAALEWMGMAQAFAGRPTDGPPPR